MADEDPEKKTEDDPTKKTAAESDYEKKFSHARRMKRRKRRRKEDVEPDDDDEDLDDEDLDNEDDEGNEGESIKDRESSPDGKWKEKTLKYKKKSGKTSGRFGFAGRHGGKMRKGSAFGFVVMFILIGVWYSSFFAPNILLVNVKEMFINDLADATIALDTYYKKIMDFKLGGGCSEKDNIKCKLGAMPRAQKISFEKMGFKVNGQKIEEDNRDDDDPKNDKPESRFKVSSINAPEVSPGLISSGKSLFEYADKSMGNKALVYGVFNPKSGSFLDTRYKQVIKSRYNMTKTVTTSGSTEEDVNKSFDSSVKNGGSISKYGRPDLSTGIGLGALSDNSMADQLKEVIMYYSKDKARSFAGIQCAWYAFGKSVMNNAKSGKAATVARFALQYLKAADAVKAGWAEEIPTNTLSAKLGGDTNGDFNGPNATDASMYKAIYYGDQAKDSQFGQRYYLDTFDLIGDMFPAWQEIMASAIAQGSASNVPGSLVEPPATLVSADRDYCIEAEKQSNHDPIKNPPGPQCLPQVNANAPPKWSGDLEPARFVARSTCPVPHDHIIHSGAAAGNPHGMNIMKPTIIISADLLSPYVAGLFSDAVKKWAEKTAENFTSEIKGIAASDAIFAGTGQVLGDHAMSRGMMPGNKQSMTQYLSHKDEVMQEYEEIAKYNASKNPFDPYNKFSFLGAMINKLSPIYQKDAPLFSTVANFFTVVRDGLKILNPTADAIYYHQPAPFDSGRLTCSDPEYKAIGIDADMACNVRYSMSNQELEADPGQVIDYMLQKHSDAYNDKLQELQKRSGEADGIDGEQANVQRMYDAMKKASEEPFIDKKTGKATPDGEYEKFLQYCVNRQDPWGRSAVDIKYKELDDEEVQRRRADKLGGIEAISPYDRGDPYAPTIEDANPSLTEDAKADQDWYTGKKCTESSEMLKNFRAYTMLCQIDGSLSGALDCSMPDNEAGASYLDPYFMSNDVLFTGY